LRLDSLEFEISLEFSVWNLEFKRTYFCKRRFLKPIGILKIR
jgi:hypothetical protein